MVKRVDQLCDTCRVNLENVALSALVITTSGHLVDEINRRVRSAGFADLRPTHGFAFTRIAAGDAGITEIAEHLEVTKQAASQLVDELARKGYVEKRPRPSDARAKLVTLTASGWAATRAADEAAAEVIDQWRELIGDEAVSRMRRDLARVTPPGRPRPVG